MKDYFQMGQYYIIPIKVSNTLLVVDALGLYLHQSFSDGININIICEEVSNSFEVPYSVVKNDIEIFHRNYSNTNTLKKDSFFPVLNTKKITTLKKKKYKQIIDFPDYTLVIHHQKKKSAILLSSFFRHLEAKEVCKKKDRYSLHVVKNLNQWDIILDDEILISGSRLEEVIIPALYHLYEILIKRAPYLILLHASGVSKNNQGVIFPAIGGSGKSTLCAALIKRGFSYINDDVIPVSHDTHHLISIPFSLGIKKGSWGVLENYYPELAQQPVFGRNNQEVKYLLPPIKKPHQKEHTAKFLVIPCYEKNTTCSMKKVPSTDGLKAIIEGESLIKLPMKNSDVEQLIDWVEKLECYQLHYDDLDDAIHILQKTLF